MDEEEGPTTELVDNALGLAAADASAETVDGVTVVAFEEAVRTDAVMVMLELRAPMRPDRRVAASLPSCVAIPSRNRWLKYGPHRRATKRELTGIRSPPMARKSISAISRIAMAI
jgi:hypothetical protein